MGLSRGRVERPDVLDAESEIVVDALPDSTQTVGMHQVTELRTGNPEMIAPLSELFE
jgi:hypothetical protein